jgi:hypothetical protein
MVVRQPGDFGVAFTRPAEFLRIAGKLSGDGRALRRVFSSTPNAAS